MDITLDQTNKNLIDELINYNKSKKIECFYVKFIQGKVRILYRLFRLRKNIFHVTSLTIGGYKFYFITCFLKFYIYFFNFFKEFSGFVTVTTHTSTLTIFLKQLMSTLSNFPSQYFPENFSIKIKLFNTKGLEVNST
jgi:hypothetical protein